MNKNEISNKQKDEFTNLFVEKLTSKQDSNVASD